MLRAQRSRPSRIQTPASVLARRYVTRYPSIGECLKRGLINHSALARLIRRENPGARLPALIAAVRRLAQRKAGKQVAEAGLDHVFRSSHLTAQGGITLLICTALRNFELIVQLKTKAREQKEVFLFMEGIKNFTIITSDPFLAEVRRALGKSILESYTRLSLLSVSLPYASVHTAGVSARLTGLLAAEGIAILQEMTSAGEYFIVLATENLSRAIEVLEYRRTAELPVA